MTPFTVNGRTYSPPNRPMVGICLDGSADEYLDAALARGRMPQLQSLSLRGFRGLARGQMPSFTNVNNASIVTGAPPRIHGIGGNYFYDAAADREVMTNDASFLRAPTLFPAAQQAGRRVAVVTAKDKLRGFFAAGLVEAGGIAFSAECVSQAAQASHGIGDALALVGPQPDIYTAEASLYVLRAGVKLLAAGRADFLYLSTTDFMQHKFPPEASEALDFYAGIDEQLGRLLELGALVGITADHGMNPKQKPDGSPNVIYLESVLNQQFGPGFRVILPITDPHLVHHGALGSFAQVHLPRGGAAPLGVILDFVRALPGVTEALDQPTAARLLELPPDRMGDFVVCAGRDLTLGRTPEWHDLSLIEEGLRSHGGRYEEMVPFLFSAPLNAQYAAKAKCDPRNFDLFDYLCNGLQA
jgi:phosphonoacetate hydrolase